MNKQMIISGLKARPVRTSVSILAVALEVVLILVIIGLANGISEETAKRTEGVGADLMLQAPNSSLILALSQSTMPLSIGTKVSELPGVKSVAPVQTLVNNSAGLEIIYGIEPASFSAMSSDGLTIQKGRLFQGPDEVVIDDIYAKKGVGIGDKVEFVGHTFTVVGIADHGKGARLFISLEAAEAMQGQQGKASLFFIKLKNPDQVQATLADLDRAGFGAYKITDMKQFASQMMSNSMPALDAFISSVVGIAVAIGVLVIFLSMYTTITERTREIGILRSLGASKAYIVSLIFQESAAICLVGAVVGVGASFMLGRVVTGIFPTLIVLITPSWILKASIFAILSGIIGSFYPSIKAAAQDPVEALAYE
jgi:putative ABC transport system permease protein